MAKPDWITISQNSGNSGQTTITITASSYTELTERTGLLTVNSVNSSASSVVSLTQLPRDLVTVTVVPSSIVMNSAQTQTTIQVVSNGSWKISSIPSWIDFYTSAGTRITTSTNLSNTQEITMTVDESGVSARTDTAVFKSSDNVTFNFRVSQDAISPTLSISPSTLTIAWTGGEYELTINSDYRWTIPNKPTWVTLSSSAGTGNSVVTFSVLQNYNVDTITGNITVTDSVNSINCSITQYGYSGDYGHMPYTMVVSDSGYIYLAFRSGDVDRRIVVNAGDVVRFWSYTYGEDRAVSYQINNEAIVNTFNYGTHLRIHTNNVPFSVYGNLLSLEYHSGFTNYINDTTAEVSLSGLSLNSKVVSAENLIIPKTNNCYYENMFQGCTSLTTAPELPATTLVSGNCYANMFKGCTSLTSAPELPATTLTQQCYFGMFSGCTSLTTAPELPATELTNNCYTNMFSNCTSLTTAPALPSTTLANYCYYSMFRGCTSLTTAPALPATTLANSCYKNMFNRCTSLIKAPVLPATELKTQCYEGMFSYCESLNYIETLAESAGNGGATYNWVSSVSGSGDFYCNANAGWEVDSVNGIPIGWTVHSIGLAPSAVTINEYMDEAEITVTAFYNWSITAPEWVNLSQTSGTSGVTIIVVTCFPNSGNTRTGTITVTDSDNNSMSRTITQAKSVDIWLSSSSETISASGGSFEFSVLSPFQNYILETESNWINISPISGTTTVRNKDLVTVIVNSNDTLDFDNDRVCHISAFTEDRQNSYVLTITQSKCNGGWLNISNGAILLTGCAFNAGTYVFMACKGPKGRYSATLGGCAQGSNSVGCSRSAGAMNFMIKDSQGRNCSITRNMYDDDWAVDGCLFGYNPYVYPNREKSFIVSASGKDGTGTASVNNLEVNASMCINGVNNNGIIETGGSMSIFGIRIGNSIHPNLSIEFYPYAVNGVLCLKSGDAIFYPTEGSTVSYTYTPLYGN